MPQVEFLADYDFRATENIFVAYKKGAVENVTKACADKAIADGKARLKNGEKNTRRGGQVAEEIGSAGETTD